MRFLKTLALLVTMMGLGCKAGTPVEPTTLPITSITLTASPTSIKTGETSVITVAFFLSDGSPASGTVTITTDFGAFDGPNLTRIALINGRATATLTAPDGPGVARVTARIGGVSSVVTVEVTSDAGQISVSEARALEHSRAGSPCEDLIGLAISATNIGSTPITFRIVGTLPAWLRVDPISGPVPSTFQAIFTCMVGEGNLDLSYTLRVQGVNAATGEDEGTEDSVAITVRVRP